jgi:ABC-type transport system involved in multi-copper enzyme maturation permease subunit
LVYSTAAVCVAFFVSSFLKRSISATIVSFLALLMILPIIQMIIIILDQEPWFIVTYSAGLITSVLGAGRASVPGHGNMVQQFTPTLGTGIAVMVAWAAICLAAGMAMAVRKED